LDKEINNWQSECVVPADIRGRVLLREGNKDRMSLVLEVEGMNRKNIDRTERMTPGSDTILREKTCELGIFGNFVFPKFTRLSRVKKLEIWMIEFQRDAIKTSKKALRVLAKNVDGFQRFGIHLDIGKGVRHISKSNGRCEKSAVAGQAKNGEIAEKVISIVESKQFMHELSATSTYLLEKHNSLRYPGDLAACFMIVALKSHLIDSEDGSWRSCNGRFIQRRTRAVIVF
jgi:hypothetical protein